MQEQQILSSWRYIVYEANVDEGDHVTSGTGAHRHGHRMGWQDGRMAGWQDGIPSQTG
jgi:hypothetical protein